MKSSLASFPLLATHKMGKKRWQYLVPNSVFKNFGLISKDDDKV